MKAAVEILSLDYSRGGEDILKDINLHLNQGDALLLRGPNGGGKTTLLRIILGLLKAKSGTVEIFGSAPENRRERLGYVPQAATIRPDFPASVMQITLMGAAAPKRSGRLWPVDAASRERALSILEILGLADKADKAIAHLSGGQRQRMLLARALMGRPEEGPFLLLLDEPATGLDVEGRGCFYELLAALREDLREDLSLIMVSHDPDAELCFFNRRALVCRSLSEGAPAQESPC